MTLPQMIASKLERLPADRQREVLSFVEFLERRSKAPAHDPEGILKDIASNLSRDDFRELRREMWSKFPREASA